MDSAPHEDVSVTTDSEPSKQKRAPAALPIINESTEMLGSLSAGMGLGRLPAAAYSAVPIAVLVAAGSYSILPIWLLMCRVWLNDPLRAIGAIFPLLAFAGTLIAWRRIGWSIKGTFWGLPIIALSILLARSTTSLILSVHVHGQLQSLEHPGLAMFVYAVGAVLLFGGTRLLRASIAPLLLLLLINPVPYAFNTLVDLPLQYLSANAARHFAHLIGLHPSGEQLRMMFSPTFGMMIVPGCNGVRGSVTLGYLALIFGYARHLRPRVLALTTLCAFLSGYALNLLRLCILVIYYRIGVTHVSIQPYGAGVDYGIGCTLFLFATLGVGLFIRWIEPQPRQSEAAAVTNSVAPASPRGYAIGARAVCFLILVLVFIVPTLGQAGTFKVALPNEQAVLASFPQQVGLYRLIRTYAEYDNNNLMRFAFADYSASSDGANPAQNLTLGVYVGSGMHLVAYSRFVQGLLPEWTGSFDTSDAGAQHPLKVHYVASVFDDGSTREYDAESACYETGCSATIESGPRMLFVSVPTLSSLFNSSTGIRLGILLRREFPDSDSTPTAMQRSQFEADADSFTRQLNLQALLQADGASI